MREILTCDFCGDEAAGTFEVVPREQDPAGEGRRMVLCPGCRDTLASVLEPLLDRADADRQREEVPTTTVVAEPDRETTTETGRNAEMPTTETGTATDIGTALDATEDVGGSPTPGADGASRARGGGDDVSEAGSRSGSTRRGAPRGYRKVMRFLEGRDFPMDREEAETMVTEAYSMDSGAVSAAIDHAVKHNRLREANGDLLR